MADLVYLVSHHHSDLVWRRTADQYRKVREKQIFQVLRLLKKYHQYRFCFAQSTEVKNFLEDHPELERKFKSYVQSGRIGLVCGMVSIPDTNMVLGESLVRNILYGREYYAKKFQVSIDVAWFMDAFGMSAQIPQILVKSGFKYLYPGRCPGLNLHDREKGVIWEGLDGSRILTAAQQAVVETNEYLCNLPLVWTKAERMLYSLKKLKDLPGQVFALYCTEEWLMEEMLFDMVKEFNTEKGGKIVFAHPIEYYERLEKRKETLPVVKGEFNPEFTGCYTTRISLKQKNRQAEESLLTAEKIASLASIYAGEPYPFVKLRNIWERLSFLQFHDGICGCHIDEVHRQAIGDFRNITLQSKKITTRGIHRLTRKIDTKNNSLIIFNTLNWRRKDLVSVKSNLNLEIRNMNGDIVPAQRKGKELFFVADAPSLGYTTYSYLLRKSKVSPLRIIDSRVLAKYAFETGKYQIHLRNGQVIIENKRTGKSIFPDENFCEIQFREDTGTLWTEKYLGEVWGEENGTCVAKKVTRGKVFTEVVIEGTIKKTKSAINGLWEGFEKLKWQKKIVFYEELEKIDLEITIYWKGRSTKVLLAFPLNIKPLEAKATYEIPYGMIERKPYYEVPSSQKIVLQEMPREVLLLAKGDWPALRWVKYCDKEKGIVLANRGTPGHRIANKEITVSLLRSGTEKESFVPPVGSYENGKHVYPFSLKPASNSEEDYTFGIEFNSPFLVVFERAHPGKLPSEKTLIGIESRGIVCSALKMSEDKKGFIIRLYDTRGKSQKLKLGHRFPYPEIRETNLIEKEETTVRNSCLSFSPFEIKTLKFG